MARSLTVKPEEGARTSALFTSFILLAGAWLALQAVPSAEATDIDPGPSVALDF